MFNIIPKHGLVICKIEENPFFKGAAILKRHSTRNGFKKSKSGADRLGY